MMHTVRIYTYLPAYPYMICTSTCWSGSKPSQATQTGQFLVSICTYCTYKRTCTIIFNGFDSVEIISLHSWVHWKFQPNYLIKKVFSFCGISLWNICLSSEWTMAIDRYSQLSHDQSDGDGGRGLSPLFASTQHFSGNLWTWSNRHDLAVTPALAVADTALARHLHLRAGVRKTRHSERGCVSGCVYVWWFGWPAGPMLGRIRH